MTKKINELIALNVMGFKPGNFGCVDGKHLVYQDPQGNSYFLDDPCLPNYMGNMAEAMAVAEKFEEYKITKFSGGLYYFSARRTGQETSYSATTSTLAESICMAAISAWGIDRNE